MKNSTPLPHKEIIQRLARHGVETKHDESGKLLALSVSCYKNQLCKVWVNAPMTIKSIECFLGY